MTTGVQLYLVSACGSAEEFVAAFRRYAERAGLFVPCAEPLPLGKRGRIAITLKDGGVMIEGEAEIVGAMVRPGIHGRVGMTLKFTEPDEPSRALLTELDRARLAMKPPPTTAIPRPANVPAEPRPIVPPIAGRVDAANALAECVVIGDVGGLKEVAAKGDPNASGGLGKFVIPTIPAVGGPARPKTPSTPPALTARPKPLSVPPPTPAIGIPIKGHSKPTRMGMPAVDRLPADLAPAVPITPVPQHTTPGLSASDRAPALPLEDRPTAVKPPIEPPIEPETKPKLTSTAVATPPPVAIDDVAAPAEPKPPQPKLVEPKTTPTAVASPPPPSPTTLGMSPIDRAPARRDPTPPPAKPTTLGMPAVKAPRTPTPYAPMPIVRLPAGDPDAEATDLSGAIVEEPAAKPLGLVAMSAVPIAPVVVEDSGRAYVGPPPKPPAPPEPSPASSRSGGLRASEIMAAIAPTDDWTMTPDASQPTVVPGDDKQADAPGDAAKPKTEPKPPPTGDWTISADPNAADGWTPPSKVEKVQPKQPATGNRVIAISSDKPLEAVEWEEKPTGIGEPLVQIDPTLMEPLKPMPALDDDPVNIVASPPRDIPPPLGPGFVPGGNQTPPLGQHFVQPGAPPPLGPPPQPPPFSPPPLGQNFLPPAPDVPPLGQHFIPTPAPGSMQLAQMMPPTPPPNATGQNVAIPTPAPQMFDLQAYMQNAPQQPAPIAAMMSRPRPDLTDGNTGFFRDSGEIPRYPTDSVMAIDHDRRRRTLIFAIGGAVAFAALIVVVMLLIGGNKTQKAGTGSNGSAVATQPADAAQAMMQPPATDAGAIAPPPPEIDAGPAAPTTCAVAITSVPSGAEVLGSDDAVLGTTPATLRLPCGVEAKLTLRKAKYTNVTKTFTPSPEHASLQVRLLAPMFSIKVTSSPAGATITVRGKNVGITPSTIRVPAFQSTAITLSKDGYQNDTQTLAPRANNATHFVVLKRGAKAQKLH